MNMKRLCDCGIGFFAAIFIVLLSGFSNNDVVLELKKINEALSGSRKGDVTAEVQPCSENGRYQITNNETECCNQFFIVDTKLGIVKKHTLSEIGVEMRIDFFNK